MQIISNNLVGKIMIMKDDVVRINLAWIKNAQEAKELLDKAEHEVYLDYPSGRTKPPKTTITPDELFELCKHPRVKYLAVSNAESVEVLKDVKTKTDKIIVPKIETYVGVQNLAAMIEMGITMIMLDKDDLYMNVQSNMFLYELLVEKVRSFKDKIQILELQGVIFM